VDLKDKVTEALRRQLHPDHIHLEDDDGISGFVVSAVVSYQACRVYSCFLC
jgi:hypothetical protein